MKITIESTTKIVTLNGVHARLWEGLSETGIRVHCFITRIAVRKDADQKQFLAELSECRAPSAEVEAIPARLVL